MRPFILTSLRFLLSLVFSGWFKRDSKDVTIGNARKANEIETKVDNLPAGDASDILHSKWRRE